MGSLPKRAIRIYMGKAVVNVQEKPLYLIVINTSDWLRQNITIKATYTFCDVGIMMKCFIKLG